MNFKDKVVVITGASSGIGEASAIKFAKKNAKVVLVARRKEKLLQVQKEISQYTDFTLVCQCDVSNKSQVKEMVDMVLDTFGRIDILVNNAGIFPKMKPLDKITEKEWNEIIDVNLSGHFRFTKYVIPQMKKNGGSIINISSDAGLKAFENFYADAYVAAKSAIILLTKSWALEYAKNNIRVNCVCAAVVDTDMTRNLWLNTKAKRKITSAEHPLGRLGKPIDVAKAVLYFASDDSSWTTGAILPVDGGVSIK